MAADVTEWTARCRNATFPAGGVAGASAGEADDSNSQMLIADRSARTVNVSSSEPASSASILRHWTMPRAVAWHATGGGRVRSLIDRRSREGGKVWPLQQHSVHVRKGYAAGAGDAARQNQLNGAHCNSPSACVLQGRFCKRRQRHFFVNCSAICTSTRTCTAGG